MEYDTVTPKQCYYCTNVTTRRERKTRRPKCLDCTLETVAEQIRDSQNPYSAGYRRWVEGMHRWATKELRKIDERETLMQQQIQGQICMDLDVQLGQSQSESTVEDDHASDLR